MTGREERKRARNEARRQANVSRRWAVEVYALAGNVDAMAGLRARIEGQRRARVLLADFRRARTPKVAGEGADGSDGPERLA